MELVAEAMDAELALVDKDAVEEAQVLADEGVVGADVAGNQGQVSPAVVALDVDE